MISKRCKYSYYSAEVVKAHMRDPITAGEAKQIFESKSIYSITGYKNFILITVNCALPNDDQYYYLQYNIESLNLIWSLNDSGRNIINSYLSHNCFDIFDMQTKFMAKVLGNNNVLG